jgi:hypothetical protein
MWCEKIEIKNDMFVDKLLFLGFRVLCFQFKLVSYMVVLSSKFVMKIILLDFLSNSYFVDC